MHITVNEYPHRNLLACLPILQHTQEGNKMPRSTAISCDPLSGNVTAIQGKCQLRPQDELFRMTKKRQLTIQNGIVQSRTELERIGPVIQSKVSRRKIKWIMRKVHHSYVEF